MNKLEGEVAVITGGTDQTSNKLGGLGREGLDGI
jgi:hypothetical protein